MQKKTRRLVFPVGGSVTRERELFLDFERDKTSGTANPLFAGPLSSVYGGFLQRHDYAV